MDFLRSMGQVLLWLCAALLMGWALQNRLFSTPAERRQQNHLLSLFGPGELREGDLIFHVSQSAQSQAIQLATHSPYSHCGIVFQENNQWQVLEAVQPVQLTPLLRWIERGKGQHFVLKRLRTPTLTLTPAEVGYLKSAGWPLLGKSYDLAFGWSDDRIYCSELIWKVYERGLGRHLGRLQQLREFDLSHPAVQARLRERYGNRLPLTEAVISPVSIFNSPELVTVLSR